MATTPDLILEGWHHLRLQRPLAAWASWQRALRARPDDNAAQDALERLANAPELPAVARLPCRFLPASSHEPTRRARWDARLPTVDLDDLTAAATAFSDLADADPTDAEARFNQALCLAWIGRNAEAVGALDQTVAALAADEPAKAADAWCLAEVLRLGAGAETLADDFRYTWDLNLAEAPPLPPDFFESWPNLAPVVIPADPLAATDSDSGAVGQAFEWLDRPIPPLGFVPTSARDLPRVLASVVATPRIVRLSSPDPTGFNVLDEPAFLSIARAFSTARRERTPLAIAWADVALGTYKLPPGLSPAARADLTRATVEHHLENRWIHQPRLALERRTPLEAAALAARGDAVARVKLLGLIQFREQLGSRPSHSVRMPRLTRSTRTATRCNSASWR